MLTDPLTRVREREFFDAFVSNEVSQVTGVGPHATCTLGLAAFPWFQQEPESVPAEIVVGLAHHCVYEAKACRNPAIGTVPDTARVAQICTTVCRRVFRHAVLVALSNGPLSPAPVGLLGVRPANFSDPIRSPVPQPYFGGWLF